MKIIKFKNLKIGNIYISNNYLNLKKLFNCKSVIVIDYNIYIIFYKILKNINNFIFIILPDKENIKNIYSLKIIWKFMIKKRINKNNLLIAIGGGVLGDIVGFISKTYFRSIKNIILPTTLLSQIDSSIGGKTAINFFSKNSIGCFNFPIFIYINYSIIYYMNKKIFKDGYAEIIKYSLINNKKFFLYLLKKNKFYKILIKSCYTKIKIISQDYNEINVRTVLNFGHTFGHCIENNIINKNSHGESIIIGMIFTVFLSSLFYSINIYEILLILNLFLKLKFNIFNYVKFNNNMIKKHLMDKKFKNKINYILIKKIGNCIQKNIKISIIIKMLKKFHEFK